MRPRQLASRFVLLALYAGVFVMLWPWIGNWYASAFRAGGLNLCRTFRVRQWYVNFRPLEKPGTGMDTELLMMHPKTKALGRRPISSRYLGYAPTTFLLALILASPVAWRRRSWAMLWGLLLIHAWIAVSLLLLVVHGFARGGPLALFSFPPSVSRGLAYVVEVVTVATVTKYAVPAVIWVLVTFRSEDWERFVSGQTPADNEV